MAIGFRSAGTAYGGATSPSGAIGLPAGIVAGDLLVLVSNSKGSARSAQTPTGYNVATNSSVNGGTGTVGADAGDNNVSVFWRIADGTETAPTITYNVGSPNSSQAQIFAFTKGASETWETAPVMASAADTAGSTTSYGTVTGNATIALAAGDWLGQMTGFNGDAGTPGSRTFSVPGVTLGTYAVHSGDTPTTAGGDLRMDVGSSPYSSGSATGAPTLARVWTSGNASFSGATVFFRLRVTADGGTPVTGTGDGTVATFTASGSGTVGLTGTGAGTSAAFTAAGSGTLLVTGTGAATAAAFTASAAGTLQLTGTGAAATSAATGSAAGTLTLTGTGAATVTPLEASGSGTVTSAGVLSGSGSATAAAFTASGSGTLALVGDGAATAAPFTATGSGTLTVTGAGELTAQALEAAGAALVSLTGAGVAEAAAFTADGAGVVAPVGGLRDITVTVGPGRSRGLSATPTASRSFTTTGASRTFTANPRP